MRMPEKDAATGSKESQRDFDFTLYSHKGGPNGWKVRLLSQVMSMILTTQIGSNCTIDTRDALRRAVY